MMERGGTMNAGGCFFTMDRLPAAEARWPLFDEFMKRTGNPGAPRNDNGNIFAKQEVNPIIQYMLKRAIKPLLLQRLREYPAVALLGSRQCGKTTLARSLGVRATSASVC